MIEVDGGQHNRASVRARDDERTLWIERNGYRVLRFWNNDVLGNLEGVLEEISQTVDRGEASPSPQPSPVEGEGATQEPEGSMMRTPVIDLHNHVGRYGHLAMDDDPERFVRIMDAAGVDRACVFCIWYGDARRANDMTARLVATHPDRFIGAAYVTPNYPEEMLPELERAFDLPGMKYVKLYPTYHAGRVIDDPVFFPVFEWADERGLAVMSHHNDWPQPLRYVGLAKRYPNVKWVIAHAGNGPMGQEDAVAGREVGRQRLPGGVDVVGRPRHDQVSRRRRG